MSQEGDGLSRLRVGGTTPSRKARMPARTTRFVFSFTSPTYDSPSLWKVIFGIGIVFSVMIGPFWTRVEYVALLAFGFALGGLWTLFALPLALAPLRRVLRQDGAALNPALGETARLQLVFAVLLAVRLWP